ncbi:retrovirus-related pol polyprotein from transposon TNT 1-94 [Tanacetum coccineum]
MSNVSPQHYHSQSSTNPPTTYHQPHSADTSQSDLGLSPTDNLIENLTNTLALLTQSYKTFLPQTNNQLRTSSNPRNQATVQDGRVVVQNVQVKCYNCNGVGHIARNCTQPKRPQNSEYFKDKMLLMQAQENEVVLDEEQLLFPSWWTDNLLMKNVDEQRDSRLSSQYPVCNEAGLSYDSDTYLRYMTMITIKMLFVIIMKNTRCTTMYNQTTLLTVTCDYKSDSNILLMIIANNLLNAELATYKEQVELYERRARFELTEREQKIDEQLRIVICDRNIKEENLKKELHSVKLQLASTIQHNKLTGR